MQGIHDTLGTALLRAGVSPLQAGIIPKGSRVNVFESIYGVFLGLGTLVGVVVVSYMLYNAYKYRAEADKAPDAARPQLGELPKGSGGGRKLFMSFGASAIIVISLIAWTYGTLLYVEQDATGGQDIAGEEAEALEVMVVGFQFGWEFHYTDVPGAPEGVMTRNTLVVPQDRLIELNVTATDVWHNFGIPELRVKTDAIPGQYTQTWFVGEETNTYTARCYELCGSGHSGMNAQVEVTTASDFESWYGQQAADQNVTAATTEATG